jgi:hypothetical protein
MKWASAISICLLLTACGGWHDLDERVSPAQTRDWPRLLPLSDLLAGREEPVSGEEDALRLSARADALRRRAAVLRTPVGDADAFEALRARIPG